MGFECQRCGKCCNTFPIDATFSDLNRWQKEKRFDILKEVSLINNYPFKGAFGFYIEKTLRNPKQPCPFHGETNECNIYDTRPKVCVDYPFSKKEGSIECPYYKQEISNAEVDEINKQQDLDFLKTAKNYMELFNILVEARQ